MAEPKAKPKVLEHPGLLALSGVYKYAHDQIADLEKTKENAKKEIKVIIDEFPDDEKFDLPTLKDENGVITRPGFNITKGKNRYSNAAAFRSYLLDHGVDPELLSDANDAAMTDGEYKLLITKAKE